MAKQIVSKYPTNKTGDDFGELTQPERASNLHSKAVLVVILLRVFLVTIGYYLILKPILWENALGFCLSLGISGVVLALAVLAGGIYQVYL